MSKSVREHQVNQDNELVNAVQGLNLPAKQMLILAIGKLKPSPVSEGQPPIVWIRISAADWSEAYNTANPYESMKAGIDHLWRSSWATKQGKGYRKYRYLAAAGYHVQEGHVELLFSQDTNLRLHGLSSEYTKFKVKMIGSLTSMHHVRIYELLAQFKTTGWRGIAVSELKEILEVGDRYPRFTDFRIRVIEPAIKAINHSTDLRIDKPEYRRRGRRIDYITFRFKVDEQACLEF